MLTQAELGQRIAVAREAASLSQADFGARLGLGQSAVSRIESGERSVSSLELAEVASVLRVSVLELLEERPVSALSVAARAQRAKSPAAVDRALQRAKDLIAIDHLLDELELPEPSSPRAPGVSQETGEPHVQGQEFAKALRERLDLGLAPIPRLPELIEERMSIDVALQPLDGGVDGLCLQAERVALLLVNSEPTWGRQRFTLCHELAHFLWGDGDEFLVDEGLFESTRPEEVRANAFAAHFLMPIEGLRRRLGDAEIDAGSSMDLVFHFGVSLEAFLWHVYNAKLVTSAERQALNATGPRALALQCGRSAEWQELEQLRSTARPPTRIVRRGLSAYKAGLIGIGPLAELEQRSDVAQLRRELEDAGISPFAESTARS
jgi:Zn-dependent peptidase ImmA (M78 family)/transcriptional regulator with XRE-family HTH domain